MNDFVQIPNLGTVPISNDELGSGVGGIYKGSGSILASTFVALEYSLIFTDMSSSGDLFILSPSSSNAGRIGVGNLEDDCKFNISSIPNILTTLMLSPEFNNDGYPYEALVIDITDTDSSESVKAFSVKRSGDLMMSIGKRGTIHPASLADTAAQNNSIYFSTDAERLVYKDNGGVVNSLY
jgi:hypothetical protein